MPEDDLQDEKLYAAAAAELDGDERDEGLWAKCFAECGGDENKAKARYIKVRVSRLEEGGDDVPEQTPVLETTRTDSEASDEENQTEEEFSHTNVFGMEEKAGTTGFYVGLCIGLFVTCLMFLRSGGLIFALLCFVITFPLAYGFQAFEKFTYRKNRRLWKIIFR